MTRFEHNMVTFGKHCHVFALMLLISLATAAQKDDVIRIRPCSDSLIMHEIDSLKNFYSNNGFALLKEATITMQSQFELPVIVPLNEGSWYQFIFIGDVSSQLYEVRMYDWNEKMVVYQKKQWGDVDGNIISYSYVPKFSEYHMMKPVQVNKHKKNLCGCVMLFVKRGPG
jgi:hypothetical protein